MIKKAVTLLCFCLPRLITIAFLADPPTSDKDITIMDEKNLRRFEVRRVKSDTTHNKRLEKNNDRIAKLASQDEEALAWWWATNLLWCTSLSGGNASQERTLHWVMACPMWPPAHYPEQLTDGLPRVPDLSPKLRTAAWVMWATRYNN